MTERENATMRNTVASPERLKTTALYLGKLKDLGLGNQDGIPVLPKTEQGHQDTCEFLAEKLTLITDKTHLGCIDGRCVICNADGSQPEVRGRQVSGTGATLEILLNGEAPITETLPKDAAIGDDIDIVEEQVEKRLGILRSAHEGGCGGARGSVAHNKAIADLDNPKIIENVKVIMQQPAVHSFTGLDYDDSLGGAVRRNAAITAEYFEVEGWDGDKYVEGVKKDEPAGVEELRTDTDRYEGHKEKGIVFVLSRDKSVDVDDFFVVGVQQSLDQANAFAGQRGTEGMTQIFIANLAKHVATADTLCSPDMPIYVVVDGENTPQALAL